MNCYFVLPKTVSLQEYTKREVIFAIELHCDNPVKKKKRQKRKQLMTENSMILLSFS